MLTHGVIAPTDGWIFISNHARVAAKVNGHTVFYTDIDNHQNGGGMFPISKGEKFTYELATWYGDNYVHYIVFYPCRKK